MECRFCFQKDLKPMLSPCRCNGTIKYVHKSCLTKWRNANLNQLSFYRCLVCETDYIIKQENFILQQIFIKESTGFILLLTLVIFFLNISFIFLLSIPIDIIFPKF